MGAFLSSPAKKNGAPNAPAANPAPAPAAGGKKKKNKTRKAGRR